MINMYSLIMILLMCLGVSVCMYSSKEMEGYPAGYLSDCPTPKKQPVITKKSLKSVSFAIQSKGHFLVAKRTRYNYYQMKELVKDPHIDFRRKTVIYVGGFLDSPTFFFSGAIAYEYMKLNYNLLSLDVNRFTTVEYPLASLYMRTVGKHAAEMIVNLIRLGLNPNTTELIGLSLGGQTISFIAKNYRLMTGRNITRMTALDPAGPCFRNLGPEDRLDQSDADFVQIVSTNIDGYGMAAPVGHVNFYVNGGEFQPGDGVWMPCNVLCSHIRAFTIWIAALKNPKSFIAMKCGSVQDARMKNCYKESPKITNVLGLNADKSKEGIFFLATSNNFPYYLGQKGLDKENEFFSSLMKNIVDSDSMTI